MVNKMHPDYFIFSLSTPSNSLLCGQMLGRAGQSRAEQKPGYFGNLVKYGEYIGRSTPHISLCDQLRTANAGSQIALLSTKARTRKEQHTWLCPKVTISACLV